MQRTDDSFLVTVESLDGGGGSTVAEGLQRELDCFLTQEPSTLWTGRQLRRCLDQDTNPLVDLYYFLADRVNHIERDVAEALQEHNMVVSDRWSDSTRAYQPVRLQSEFASLDEARDYVRESLRPIGYRPDLTFWIDVEPEVCIERLEETEDDVDKHENLDTLQHGYEEYNRLERRHSRIVRVDGHRPVDEVLEACLDIVSIYRNG